MEKEQIMKVLEEWNFWNRDLGKYTGKRREHTKMIEKFIKEREIITISGPRRAGKSTTMYQLMEKIAGKGSIEQVLYVNFEDPAFLPFLSVELLEEIYDTYREKMNPSKKAYLFLDEVQNIAGWEKWVRSYYDKKENVKFVISGSSSKLLSSEFSTLLTGRFVNFEVFPLSFAEFLEFRGVKIPKRALKEDERKARHHLEEYFRFGGFPDVVLKTDNEVKLKTLEQYFESMIMRDIVERYQIRDVLSLKQAAVFGMTNVAKEFSFNTLRKTLKISLESARDYAGYLEQAYMLFQLPYFSYSLKEAMARNRKLYSIDSGLRNAVSKSFSADLGRIAENAVYLHLRRKRKDVHYWKGKQEVDFVVKNGEIVPINVTYGRESPEREKKALLEFLSEFKLNRGIIITDAEERKEQEDGKTISYMPLWKFLLADS